MDKPSSSGIHQKWIVFERFPRKHRILSTFWFSTCVVNKWPFWTRSEQNRHFGQNLSWYDVVNSNKTHPGEVALFFLYLLIFFPRLCAKYSSQNSCEIWITCLDPGFGKFCEMHWLAVGCKGGAEISVEIREKRSSPKVGSGTNRRTSFGN